MFVVGNDLMCFTDFVQSFEASLKIVFAFLLVKECMSIRLFSNLLHEEWKEILLLWEQGIFLDGYDKLLSRP
jgi:hypothetical protein